MSSVAIILFSINLFVLLNVPIKQDQSDQLHGEDYHIVTEPFLDLQMPTLDGTVLFDNTDIASGLLEVCFSTHQNPP